MTRPAEERAHLQLDMDSMLDGLTLELRQVTEMLQTKSVSQVARELGNCGPRVNRQGPNRAMITVGLFAEDDGVGTSMKRHYGSRIQELKKRFPCNLSNGATVVERAKG